MLRAAPPQRDRNRRANGLKWRGHGVSRSDRWSRLRYALVRPQHSSRLVVGDRATFACLQGRVTVSNRNRFRIVSTQTASFEHPIFAQSAGKSKRGRGSPRRVWVLGNNRAVVRMNPTARARERCQKVVLDLGYFHVDTKTGFPYPQRRRGN